jgi:hypothetical protein
VSEWFGHRVHPGVSHAPNALSDQQAKRCPFLTAVKQTKTDCIKSAAASGVCTISASSNGSPQDWLVCPYRAFQPEIVEDAVRRIFGVEKRTATTIVPGPMLADPKVRESLERAIGGGARGFVYLSSKLGGEISISPTNRSPELSFDVTVAEVTGSGGAFGAARYGILEIQTMDFHGSYRAVVENLEDALRLHRAKFPRELERHPEWLSKKMEGPNIANVFKRTFYQMMLKFRIAGRGACAGCVLAIPASVWDSWQRHLGAPQLTQTGPGAFSLAVPGSGRPSAARAWIYVFDIAQDTRQSPSPIVIQKVIATDAAALGHYALEVAPEAALEAGSAADRVLISIADRISSSWPGFTTLA